jgi:hypothetical protein
MDRHANNQRTTASRSNARTSPNLPGVLAVVSELQRTKPIPRPSLGQSFIPVVGPTWEAAADFEDGNYGGMALNGAFAIADALPVGVGLRGLRAASKGIGAWKTGSVTADAARKMIRKKGLASAGDEIHHAVPLDGIGRNVQDWRNHYLFLKTLPKEQHRRLTGSWDGRPMYDPIRKVWYGTTDWMKAVPTGLLSYVGDGVENLQRGSPPHEPRR